MGERRRQHEVPALKVSEVVTRNVCIANADETIQDAARIMAEIDAGVVPVGKDGKLVGILSLGEVAVKTGGDGAGEALAAISRPDGAHSQSTTQPH